MDRVDEILRQWRRERPDLDVAPMGLIGRLNRLARQLSREMEQTFRAHGLNAASFDVLATLRRSGPPYALSPGRLMATMMITSGTMTNRIDQLERAGLVARTANPDDARSFIVSLTEAGFAAIDAAVTDHVATQARLVARLPEADRPLLDRLLRRYLLTFEGEGDEAPPD
jgi:DNA-binding MarR family transcriptional regulator